MDKYKVIGIMSGTSLDGLDIAYCEFRKNAGWNYKIIHAETVRYNTEWVNKLSASYKKKSTISDFDKSYGTFIAKEALRFIKRKKIIPDFIASHGHTVFHQPEKGITVQIGSGPTISNLCKLPVICDFRIGDVKLGGQGAPLVPLVDKLLFADYKQCLNLGGFANISYDNSRGERIAFDICPVNIVLNYLANQRGEKFDKSGRMASKGNVNDKLLEKLNALPFYSSSPPKSLGREWVEKNIFPLLSRFNISVNDKLCTVCEHIAVQISRAVISQTDKKEHSILITGGGAYNSFLMKRISRALYFKVKLPDDKTIQFKEAMAFAFLGVLRWRNEINILKSVTGARRDSSGGKISYPH